MKRKGDPTNAIVVMDKMRYAKWRMSNQRMLLAIDAVLMGYSSIELQQRMKKYAEEHGETHPGWFVRIETVRKVMERARVELGKDLSRSRASEYAKHQARLEHLYSLAMKYNDRAAALAVLKEQSALSDRLFGVIQGGKKDGQSNTSSARLNEAITGLTATLADAIDRRSRASKEGTAADADAADVSPVPGGASDGDDLGAEVAEASSD
jgi:hypothetical protein